MTRHEIRKEIFKAVFSSQFHQDDEIEPIVEGFFEGRSDADEEDLVKNDKSEKDEEYVRSKTLDIINKIPQIDEVINATVDGWKTSRMNKVDLSLIRLAYYEAKFEDMPVGVAIDEAVGLADEFGTDSSANFVNGALAKLLK